MREHSCLEAVLPYRTENLLEHYRLGKEIGRGGFGVVRECTRRQTSNQFACKTVAKSDAFICRELRGEIKVLQHLSDHPNIVKLHEVYEDYRDVNMIMDLCKDGDLDNYLRKMPENRLEESHAAKIFAQIAEAVQFCHSNGVMHRDIKPKNILLDPPNEVPSKLKQHSRTSEKNSLRSMKSHSKVSSSHGSKAVPQEWKAPVVKLADFGRSVFLQEGEEVSGLVCTYHFAPPEAIPPNAQKQSFGNMFKGNGRYGFEADVWSLGVTLYMMLSGTLPFDSEISDEDLFNKIQSGNVDVRSGPWQNISSPARGLVLRMLSLDPKRRLTIDKVLSHPWLQMHTQSSSSMNKHVSLSIDHLYSPSFKARLSSLFPLQSVSHNATVYSRRENGLINSLNKHLKENDLKMNKNVDLVDAVSFNSPNSSIPSPKSCTRFETSVQHPRSASMAYHTPGNKKHFSPASSIASFSSENVLSVPNFHSLKLKQGSRKEELSSLPISPRKLFHDFEIVECNNNNNNNNNKPSESRLSRFLTDINYTNCASYHSNKHNENAIMNGKVLSSWKSMRSTKSAKVVPFVS